MIKYNTDFEKALAVGRPPSIVKLFPNSKALIVSGKYIDRAMLSKGKALTIAANGRSTMVIRGTLLAAQRANAAVIIEIAKSEGGAEAYCAVSLWNMATYVDKMCNELGITVPVAIHADHYGIKNEKDMVKGEIEIPSLFDAGITSIAIDASHQPDDQNLLTNIAMNHFVPDWAGLETEVGEIKGSQGLSTPEEALFLIQGLNANNIFPDWIALNNGTTHGIEQSDAGIQVELTAAVHDAIAQYRVSGAQHGTSGNSSERLREIASKTNTTKANVATALQMISSGNFIKIKDAGLTEELWAEMVAYADSKQLKKGDYKKLNLPFENKILGQAKDVRDRMAAGVEEFVYSLLTSVFNAADTAPLAIEEILKRGSFDPGPKVERLEDPAAWTTENIIEKAKTLDGDKGPAGDFDD